MNGYYLMVMKYKYHLFTANYTLYASNIAYPSFVHVLVETL